MKVTVCFGTVRVVVPCGCHGELTVCKLINEAVARYKKATNKPADHVVTVHSLRSSSDFAILDEDDLISDVADDKDQIIAEFEEVPPDGDSTRMTSYCHNGDVLPPFVAGNNNNNTKDIFVGVDISCDLASKSVVAGDNPVSDGNENLITPDTNDNQCCETTETNKAAVDHLQLITDPIVDALPSPTESELSRFVSSEPSSPCLVANDELNSPYRSNIFVRDSARKSLGNGLSMNKWFVAQEKLIDQYEDNARNSFVSANAYTPVCAEDKTEAVVMTSTVIHSSMISPVMDTVNDLIDSHSGSAPSCLSPPRRPPRHSKQTPANDNAISVIENEITVVKPSEILASDSSKSCSSADSKIETMKTQLPDITGSVSLSVPQASCVSPKPAAGVTLSSLKSGVLAPTNTRRIGNKVAIDLVKGLNGLGFSITSRDNLAGVNCPIYIKNVLPLGAAIEDGRLKPGDRLLEVNGVKITGLGQSEAAALLRGIPQNGIVHLVISRQMTEEIADIFPVSDTLAQQDNTADHSSLTVCEPASVNSSLRNSLYLEEEPNASHSVKCETEAVAPDGKSTMNHPNADLSTEHEHLTFHIALAETGFASLGISVKKLTVGRKDLGIFIKSVLIGGTAAKDGRLRVNDQLIQVNGVSLLGLDNANALQVLREAMQKDGRLRGFIGISIARPKNSQVNPQPVTVGLREVRVSQLDQDENDDSNSSTVHQTVEIPVSESPSSCYSRSDAVAESDLVTKNELRSQQPLPVSTKSDRLKEPPLPTFEAERRILDMPSPSVVGDADSVVESDNNCDVVRDETSSDYTESTPGFHREGFGRQSMSEKRKGHIDPKNLDVYQKIKGGKNKTPHNYASWDPRKSLFHRSAGSESDVMLASGGSVGGLAGRATGSRLHEFHDISKTKEAKIEVSLKKYRSLEDLQPEPTLSQQSEQVVCPVTHKTGNASVTRPATAGVSRTCGGNESFRAAVDRSYDGTDSELMETVEEDTAEIETVNRFAVITTPKSSKAESHVERDRTWGLFKGIAGIFRLVKPKKNEESKKDKQCDTTGSEIQSSSGRQEIVREVSKSSKFYVPEEFANGKSHKHEVPSVHPRVVNSSLTTSYDIMDEASSDLTKLKLQRMQELRRQHQRSHRERSGHYPLEEREDQYELQIQEYEKQLKRTAPTLVSHSRSRSGPAAQPSERQVCWPESYNSAGVTQNLDSDHSKTAKTSVPTVMRLSNPQSSAEFHLYRPKPLPVYHPADANVTYYLSSRGNEGDSHESESRSAFNSYNHTDNHINLPPRNHAVHVPIGFVTTEQLTAPGYLHSQSVLRRSYREPTNSDFEGSSAIGFFQRFVSLPPRQRRNRRDLNQNRYEVALARSAQV